MGAVGYLTRWTVNGTRWTVNRKADRSQAFRAGTTRQEGEQKRTKEGLRLHADDRLEAASHRMAAE